MLEFDGNPMEEIMETYGGFPLKDNFLEIANDVLKKDGLKAEYSDGRLFIPFISRPYYSEEELQECRDDGFSEKDIRRMEASRFYAEIVIYIEDPRAGIRDVGYEFKVDGDGEYDDEEIQDSHISDDEYDRIVEMIEAILNAATDCD